jgi:serine/threonine-protein kinase
MQGQVISNRYRLLRQIGKGGMGSVWLAEHTALKSEVAVKLIASDLGRMSQVRARFLREAQLAARIKSAHVTQVHDYGVGDDGQPYIAMEYLVGMTLRDRLDHQSRLTRAQTARVVSHVCRALSRAHEAGLIHRDLKPENIFIVTESDDEIIKVLDFGVAKAADALADSGIDPTRTGAIVGTPFYMSPEQAQGLKTVDRRTDFWALGVVVFECLTGSRPFAAEALGPLIAKVLTAPIPPPSALSPDATPEIDAWMSRALARDPAARFSSAQELAESFMIAAGTAESSRRDGPSSERKSAPSSPLASSTINTLVDVGADIALAETARSDHPALSPDPVTRTVLAPERPIRTSRRWRWALAAVFLCAAIAGLVALVTLAALRR